MLSKSLQTDLGRPLTRREMTNILGNYPIICDNTFTSSSFCVIQTLFIVNPAANHTFVFFGRKYVYIFLHAYMFITVKCALPSSASYDKCEKN